MILSTHIVDDVKELCTNMAIINHGTVLYQGNPLRAREEVNGKVWRKTIEKGDLEDYKKDYHVISDRLIAGKPEIHILADEKPDPSFHSIEADLEDVYFSHILKQEQEPALA